MSFKQILKSTLKNFIKDFIAITFIYEIDLLKNYSLTFIEICIKICYKNRNMY